jgi:hypothetical protein
MNTARREKSMFRRRRREESHFSTEKLEPPYVGSCNYRK